MNQRIPSGPAARAMLENLIREPQFLVTAREGFEVYLELEKDEVDEVEDVVKTAFKQMRDVWNDNNARKFKEIGAEMMEDLEKIPSWRTFAEPQEGARRQVRAVMPSRVCNALTSGA